MTAASDPAHAPSPAAAPPTGGGSLAWGVLLIAGGLLAVAMPGVAALATALVLGWLLVLAGVFEIAHAIHTRRAHGLAWKLVSGLLTLGLGVVILAAPVTGVASLALVIGAFLFVAGIARTLLAMHLRPLHGWGWVLFDGLLSIAVAILVAIGWPESSVPLIGLLTGLSLISAGIWRIVLRRHAAG